MLCVEWSDRVKGEMQERGETGRRKGPENGGAQCPHGRLVLDRSRDLSSSVTEEGPWSLVRLRQAKMSEFLTTFSMEWEARHHLQGRSWGQKGGALGERRKYDAVILERGKANV